MIERRSQPRIPCAYSAIVRGYDRNGRFEEQATLCNYTGGGLYLKLNRRIEQGVQLSVMARLSSSPDDPSSPSLATRAVVVRTEPQEDGTCGLGLKFELYHFI